jgi:iron complex transport system substrate-binding protein
MKIFQFFCLQLFLISVNARALECNHLPRVKTLKPQFAKNFTIDYYKNFKIIKVDKFHYLLSRSTELGCEWNGTKILTPVKRVVMMSTTYLPALELLGFEKSLMAFQGKRYIVSKAFKLESLQEVASTLSAEYLLKLKADLIMSYNANLSSPQQLPIFKSLNLPLVFNKDFEETNPLARAEWLVFISAFYEQEEKALGIFQSIVKDYQKLKNINAKNIVKPKVLIGDIQNGYWVTSGGKSDLAQLIADAGGEMLFSLPSPTTQKISLEEVSKKKISVDFWLTHNMWGNHSELEQALKKDSRYMLISAKNIYNNNLITNKDRFNDYWETGMQRPDLLLRDLTTLFHSSKEKSPKLRWYQKL